jgi:hypothetical protein
MRTNEVLFYNRDCVFGYCKAVYPQVILPTRNPRSIFVDIGLKAAQSSSPPLRSYASYIIRLSKLYNAPILAVVPDVFGDASKNIELAREFLRIINNRFRDKQIKFLIVLHRLDGHVDEYRELVFRYLNYVDVGIAIPSRESDVKEPTIKCREEPRACAQRIVWAVSQVAVGALTGVHVHILGALKPVLASLIKDYNYVPNSFDTDAYRLVSNDRLRKECLGDGRYMIDPNKCPPEKWAREWLKGVIE